MLAEFQRCESWAFYLNEINPENVSRNVRDGNLLELQNTKFQQFATLVLCNIRTVIETWWTLMQDK